MFFGGDRGRGVNLSGRGVKKPADVVDAAKKAREEREKQKKRELAIQRLQATWRSSLALRAARRETAASWCLEPQRSSQQPPSADLLLQGLRQFNFFSPNNFNDATFNINLSFLMRLMAKSILSNDAALNLAAQAHHQSLQWVYPIRKFLLTMQKVISSGVKKAGSSSDLNLAVQLLAFFTESSNIDKFAPTKSDTGRIVVEKLVVFLVQNGISSDISAALRTLESASQSASSSSPSTKLQSFSESQLYRILPGFMRKLHDAYCRAPSEALRKVLESFSSSYIREFMSLDIPASILSGHMPLFRDACAIALTFSPLKLHSISDIESATNLGQIMRHIVATVTSDPAQFGSDAIPSVFNSVAFTVDEIDRFTTASEKSLLQEIENVERGANIPISPAKRRPARRASALHAEDELDVEIDDHSDAMEGVTATSVPEYVSGQISVLAAKLGTIERLRTTVRDNVIRQLYQPYVLKLLCGKMPDQPQFQQSSAAVVQSLSQLIRVATRYIDDSEFLDQIYEVVSPVVLPSWHGVIKPTLQQSSSGGLGEPSLQRLTGLFCRCYAYVLQNCTSEEDFFVHGSPFSTKEVVEMILLLRKIPLYRLQLFGQSIPAGSLADWDNLLQDIQELWLQLFRRQWRKSFTQFQNFFIMSLSADDIIESVVGIDRHPILLHCPLLIPTAEKVKLLHHWLENDKVVHQPSPAQSALADWENEDAPAPILPQQIKVQIRRSHVVEDTLRQLASGKSLKKKIKVEFIRDDGEPEPGVDGGGLFRELFSQVIEAGISLDFGLFTENAEHTLFPHPDSSTLAGPDHLKLFEAFGKFVGKSFYERLLLELPLAQFFVSALLNRKIHLSDMVYLDAELAENLFKLTKMSDEELADFNFTTTTNTTPPRTIDLVPNGSQVSVTRENVWRYIRAVAEFKLYGQTKSQVEAFARGFREIVPHKWSRIFSEDEFLINIVGTSGRIDLADLQRNAEFSGGYWDGHPTILMLWEVLSEMDDDSHSKFLKFVTSHSRPPILGFKTLVPKFAIKKPSEDADRLPSANTCMNLFKLPPYRSKAVMKEKLLYAINAGAGFELS